MKDTLLFAIHGRMKQLDYLNLVSEFNGKTIKLPIVIEPANKSIKPLTALSFIVLDTGDDTTAFTREFLKKSGYGVFSKSGKKKNTATGEIELLSCEINGITLANQFKFDKIKVDVLENWKSHTIVGLIGMDILSQMTFILSHEHRKFLFTNQNTPQLANIFA